MRSYVTPSATARSALVAAEALAGHAEAPSATAIARHTATALEAA